MRLYRARWSTNVERVALALAHKGLEVESVWIDYADRSPVEEVSGQGLVPVLIDDDGTVVSDSPRILAYLEQRHPEPALFPSSPARRSEAEMIISWFNQVWKRWPNGIESELGKETPDQAAIDEMSRQMSEALDRFEAMLTDRPYLFGDDFTAVDCIVYPFVKYAAGRDPADDELFHIVLAEHQSVEGRPKLASWIDRVGQRPQA